MKQNLRDPGSLQKRSFRQDSVFYTPYTFSAKERDLETVYSYFGARYYYAILSVWLSVDPMAHERSWLSPYNYVQNNSLNRIDPNGLICTDYYDWNTGKHLGHVDDGIYEAIGINVMVYDAMVSEGSLSNKNAKELGGVTLGTNSDFEVLSAAIYAEMDYLTSDYREAAAMYDVLRNRAEANGTTVMEELVSPKQVVGYAPGNDESEYNKAFRKGRGFPVSEYNETKHNAARQGIMVEMGAKTRYSNGGMG